MSAAPRVSNPVWSLLPTDVEGFAALAELALDLRWSWNHAADDVWRQLDPDLWELTHNPWGVLQTVSRDRVERVLGNPALRARIDELVHAMQHAATSPRGSSRPTRRRRSISVAYFSMEYMLSEALPIYSGGLGNVAGDQLKAASDLGVPVIAVGLLYQQGYFRQVIDKDGAQQALYPVQRSGTAAHHGRAPPQRRVAAAGDRPARVLRLAARLAGPGGPGEALSAGQQRRRQRALAPGHHE